MDNRIKLTYKNTWINGFIFVSLFVLQQILAFICTPFTLVTPYWIFIIAIFIIVGISLPYTKYINGNVFKFALVCAFFSLFTFSNGTSIGNVVCKVLYMLFAFWGYIFIVERKIKLEYFGFLLLIFYFVFYGLYFKYDAVTRLSMDKDLFGHASSNTIAMTLNMVLYLYMIISWVYRANNKTKLIIFSGINLFLIIMQGSRAGMLVALLLLLINLFLTKSKNKRGLIISLLFFGIAIIYIVIKYLPLIEGFLTLNEISSNAYEEDIRSEALSAFFKQMNFGSFLFGYSNEYYFLNGDMDRTFNAFIDFWKVYGFVPFVFMIVLFVKRIINHKQYNIPLIMLLPFVTYSLFESLWGGSLWDIFLFIILFYSKNDKNNCKVPVESA